MSTKSEGWNDSHLEEVITVKAFITQDGGVTIRYLYAQGAIERWMEEHFEPGEKACRRVKCIKHKRCIYEAAPEGIDCQYPWIK